MRKLILALAVIACAASGAAPATAGTHPVTHQAPRVFIGETLYYQNVADGLWLHAHSLNGIMSDNAVGQVWAPTDAQSWPSNHNGTVTTVEFRLTGTTYCAKYNTGDGGVYLNPCVGGFGDGTEQWWVPRDFSTGGDWLVNAFGSAHTPNPPHVYCYATDSFVDNGGANNNIVLECPSSGNWSEFAPACVICSPPVRALSRPAGRHALRLAA